MRRYESWGRVPKAVHDVIRYDWRDMQLPESAAKPMLVFGNGRSYGDCCLNDRGMLIDAGGLDRFIAFDPEGGVLRCEAGVKFSDILGLVVKHGWFLPVTPGTSFVTVGGALANDVHGKNHHRAGTFGRHVVRFELLRSDGERLTCSPTENPQLFHATIGGMGLTGLVTWVEVQLAAIPGDSIDQEVIRYGRLDEFFQLSRESDRDFEYTVAWVDCSSGGAGAGRGLFIRGNHAHGNAAPAVAPPKSALKVPFDPPFPVLGGPTLRIFNELYYRKHLRKRTRSTTHYRPFFYPLDAISSWNRLYGPKGFFQYQCVIPPLHAEAAVREILQQISRARTGSFLAVLKNFGSIQSPGMLSFPRPGTTLALDFPNEGTRTLRLLDRLDEITFAAQGALYPAKDARMSTAAFAASFPNWADLRPFIDHKFSSSFWRRVSGQTH